MHILFLHTPLPSRNVEGRALYWQNFDKRYYAMHPGARPLTSYFWELPQWITWLGGVLEQAGFSSCETLNLYTDYSLLGRIDEAGIYTQIARHPADVFLLSPMTVNLPYALDIANMIKELYPQSHVIFGGVVATPLSKEILKHPGVDFVVVGRAEYALPALLKALRDHDDLSHLGNIAYKGEDGKVITTSHIYAEMPVEQIPFPKVDLFPSTLGNELRYIRLVYSLGCPYQCAFCSIQTIGRKPAYFPIDRVLSEMRAYQSHYGTHHHVYFGDETFTLHTKHTVEFCTALAKERDIRYDCQTRLNRLQDSEVIEALQTSGCCWVEVGIETTHQKSLDLSNKRSALHTIENTLVRLRDAGIPVCAFMVIGFPNETPDDARQTIDWTCSLIQRGLLHASYLSNLVPYPGTPMYDHPERFGMTIHHHQYELYHEDLMPVFSSSNSTAEQNYRVFLEGVKQIAYTMGESSYLKATSVDLPSPASYGAYWRGDQLLQ